MSFNTAALLEVRDEESLIERNVCYHLDIGFTVVAVLDHCSTDGTSEILKRISIDRGILVTRVDDPSFDHGKLCNHLLQKVLEKTSVDWIFPLDTDEFFYAPGGIAKFIEYLLANDILYGSVQWFNSALWESKQFSFPLFPKWFYKPWPERLWQHHGHFRKSFCRVHKDMEVVVGGHYFRREANLKFFQNRKDPVLIPSNQANIFHFEFRESIAHLFKKWKLLAQFEKDSSSPSNAPWLERIQRIRQYVSQWESDHNKTLKYWKETPRTFWGTPIPPNKLIFAPEISNWNALYIPQYDDLLMESRF